MNTMLSLVPGRLRHLLWQRSRTRLWETYDQAYASLFGHSALHERWFADRQLLSPGDNILSIGPGRGELELSLCRDYSCHLAYAEPQPRYWRAMEESFRAAGLDNRIIQRHRRAYQSFAPQQPYQLILAIQSWYSFGYDEALLRKALAALSPGGSFVLTVTAGEDVFLRALPSKSNFSAESLSAWAGNLGFEHELHYLQLPLPATQLLVDGSLTEAARDVSGFLLGRLWRKIPLDERRRIKRNFAHLAHQSEVERVYGLLHFRVGQP